MYDKGTNICEKGKYKGQLLTLLCCGQAKYSRALKPNGKALLNPSPAHGHQDTIDQSLPWKPDEEQVSTIQIVYWTKFIHYYIQHNHV